MTGATLSFAFAAGLLASVNPCGFVMLPALVGYYLGTDEPSFVQVSLKRRVGRALALGLSVTLSFLLIFGVVGALVMSGGRAVLSLVPYASLLIGVVLVLLGVWLLVGKVFHIPVPQPSQRFRRGSPFATLLFGASYAVTSLSCTLPIFLVAVGQSMLAASWSQGILSFVAYGAGMGSVLLVVSLTTAIAQAGVRRWSRRVLPFVTGASGAVILLAGLYIIVTQIQLLQLAA